MLALEAVTYSVGPRTIIEDVSVVFRTGPRSVILGPNGAGKSVLLRLCHGLISPTRGKVHWAGTGAAVRGQAMVFQRPVLLRRSAAANVVFALRMRGMRGRECEERAREALERVGLGRAAEQPARVLSGGEQQRLALARAWAVQPSLMLLDEPTANLDPGATREVEAIIQAIHESGTKIVMTTHNLGQARRLADEILFLDRGQIVEHGSANEFFEQPASHEAAAFMRGELPWH